MCIRDSALYDEELGQLGIALRAVGEFAGQVRGLQQRLAAGRLTRLAGSVAGLARLLDVYKRQVHEQDRGGVIAPWHLHGRAALQDHHRARVCSAYAVDELTHAARHEDVYKRQIQHFSIKRHTATNK